MTSKPWDKSKPTFYLDQSTLCDAYRAQGHYTKLRPWVERVAREANLCVSISHVLELAQWQDVRTANLMAMWLDSMPLVWCYARQHTELVEAEYWLKVSLGIAPREAAVPFAPSMLRVITDLKPEQTPEWLALPTLPEVVYQIRDSSPEWQKQAQDFSLGMAATLQDNLRWAEQAMGWKDEDIARETARKRAAELRWYALTAERRLLDRRDEDYPPRPSDDDTLDVFRRFVEANPAAMPGARVGWAFLSGFRNAISRKDLASKSSADALSSSMHDWAHLMIGAAYCDVFTCDRLVSKCLGDIRPASLGRRRQLAVEKGVERFVDDLMGTWPAEPTSKPACGVTSGPSVRVFDAHWTCEAGAWGQEELFGYLRFLNCLLTPYDPAELRLKVEEVSPKDGGEKALSVPRPPLIRLRVTGRGAVVARGEGAAHTAGERLEAIVRALASHTGSPVITTEFESSERELSPAEQDAVNMTFIRMGDQGVVVTMTPAAPDISPENAS